MLFAPHSASHLIELLTGPPRQPDKISLWPKIIGWANQTLTTATLAQRVMPGSDIPDDVRAFLNSVHHANTERNRRLREQLDQVVAALAAIKVTPILIKGAALLIEQDRISSSGRILSDLDLLLPSAAVQPAVECLAQNGYAIFRRDAPDVAPAVLFRTADVGMVDLHSRMKSAVPRLIYETVRPFCTLARLGTHDVLIPSPTLQTAILVSHDQLQELDYWRGLIDVRHLADMAALARSDEGIDWQQLDALFPDGVARSALRTQLLCLHKLSDVDVPRQWLLGLSPKIQFYRRLVQMRWPALRLGMTMLTLVFAGMPSFVVEMLCGAFPNDSKPSRLSPRTLRHILAKMLRRRAIGKLG
jgi:Uncharacterised nucleotidyltransferase